MGALIITVYDRDHKEGLRTVCVCVCVKGTGRWSPEEQSTVLSTMGL